MINNPSRKQQKLHALAMKQFDNSWSSAKDERDQNLEDRRFYSISGAQWEGDYGEQFENKPKLEINKSHLSVMRIITEYRNNRISVEFQPKNGDKSTELSDTCSELYRADELDSQADEAKDNAFEEAVGGGIGAFRLRAKYEDEEGEDIEDDRQRICFEPIYDADKSVFWDANAKRQDKSDAKHCFVLTEWDRDAYEKEYPDDNPTSWPNPIGEGSWDWYTKDSVFTCEYYLVDEVKDEIIVYENPLTGDEERFRGSDFNEEKLARLIATGFEEASRRSIKRKIIRKYILSGQGILKYTPEISGQNIPIVPVYGKRWFVEGIERCMGHVRLVKDAQRLKNMQISKLADISARSSYRKPIMTPKQVAGHENWWAEDAVEDRPYMLINPLEDAEGNTVASPPIGYTETADIPPAMAGLLQLTDNDIKELLGNEEKVDEMNPNMSGVALENWYNRMDMQAFIYISNMAKAMRRAGEVWLSMAKAVYFEDNRKLKTVSAVNNETSQITLNRPMKDEDTGKTYYENDLSKAKFDVYAEAGPSSSSRKSSVTNRLINMLQYVNDPADRQVLIAMILMNMEGEGVQDVRAFFRKKLVSLKVVEPTEEEQIEIDKAAKNAQPSAQDQLALSMAKNEEAKAMRAEADTEKAIAQTAETKAKIAEILAGIDRERQNQVLEMVEKLGQASEPSIKTLS